LISFFSASDGDVVSKHKCKVTDMLFLYERAHCTVFAQLEFVVRMSLHSLLWPDGGVVFPVVSYLAQQAYFIATSVPL